VWKDFAYTGPDTIAGQYMRRFWQPIYVARDLKPGKAMPIRIMSEDFTLYRGQAGTPHVVGFRCAHRGTGRVAGKRIGDQRRVRHVPAGRRDRVDRHASAGRRK
jgi:5,5'-dehydrodivanillate O-demethylase oxygenase subunit